MTTTDFIQLHQQPTLPTVSSTRSIELSIPIDTYATVSEIENIKALRNNPSPLKLMELLAILSKQPLLSILTNEAKCFQKSFFPLHRFCWAFTSFHQLSLLFNWQRSSFALGLG
jgi:hypothetical protein